MTRAALRAEFKTDERVETLVRNGMYTKVGYGNYAEGPEPPTRLETAIGSVYGTSRTARGLHAGVILGLDGMPLVLPKPTRIRSPMIAGDPIRRYGVSVTNGLQTIVDLAAILNDSHWEMANESALHNQLYKLAELAALIPTLSARRHAGTQRVRRVLALRPIGAPPTESALETLMVQAIRLQPEIPEPTRQLWLYNEYDEFVARIDLCWPELGLFLELDGQGHAGQPIYDANRQTAIAAVTGWLCARKTWTEVNEYPLDTARSILRLVEQTRRRPLPVG